MRVMECAYGRVLKATHDEELFGQVRNHLDQEHPEKEVTDEQILNLIEAKAYNAEDDSSKVEGKEEEKGLMDTIKDKLTDQ
jgi:predicted small metal-binding protein